MTVIIRHVAVDLCIVMNRMLDKSSISFIMRRFGKVCRKSGLEVEYAHAGTRLRAALAATTMWVGHSGVV